MIFRSSLLEKCTSQIDPFFHTNFSFRAMEYDQKVNKIQLSVSHYFLQKRAQKFKSKTVLKPCGTVVLLFALWKKQAKTVELVFICLPLCLGRVFKSYFPSHQFCWNHCFNAKFV